jgi:hypothetical protein
MFQRNRDVRPTGVVVSQDSTVLRPRKRRRKHAALRGNAVQRERQRHRFGRSAHHRQLPSVDLGAATSDNWWGGMFPVVSIITVSISATGGP